MTGEPEARLLLTRRVLHPYRLKVIANGLVRAVRSLFGTAEKIARLFSGFIARACAG